MELFKRFLLAIVGSKKAVAAVATVIFLFIAPQLGELGIEVTQVEIQAVVALVIAYLVGQGIADNGKGAVQAQLSALSQINATGGPGSSPPVPTPPGV
jgi:hypothetical protein